MTDDVRNPGTGFERDQPGLGPAIVASRTPSIVGERVLKAILEQEFERLAADSDEARRLLSYVLHQHLGAEEIQRYVTHLAQRPPQVRLGYPRDGVELPMVSIVLGEEHESEHFVGRHIGESVIGEEGPFAEMVGSMWDVTWHVHIFAENPDVTLYLYHLTKLFLVAAGDVLEFVGLQEPSYAGTDLNPQEAYVPENVYVRILRVSARTVMSAPLLRRDPSHYRLGGVFVDDMIVDGVRGGVKPRSGTT